MVTFKKNFSGNFFWMPDILLLLLLAVQLLQTKELSGGRAADDFQKLKELIFQAGTDAETGSGTETDADTKTDTETEGTAGAEEIVCGSFVGKEELTAETAAAIENFASVTVLITNKAGGGYFHSTLSFSLAADAILTSEDGVTYLKAGDARSLDATDHAVGESFLLEKAPDASREETEAGDGADTGSTAAYVTLDFTAEAGVSDVRTYAGTLEITVTEEGFLLRNTLPLEEYLRYVVPAEMPASYPEEAQKAQAICARTYALRSSLSGAFSEYGADISDDSSCQVYNTQGTDTASDAAVLATAGTYLVFEGEPAECYYFSTSCGVTTDASIWGEEISYLRSVPVSGMSVGASVSEAEKEPGAEENSESGEDLISEENSGIGENSISENISGNGEDQTGEEAEIGELLKNEENLRSFLDDDSSGAEAEEPWYRWEVTFPAELLAGRLEEEIGEILAIEVTERGSGGVAVELAIYGSSGQKVIESQYAIREFFRLGDGVCCIRQDGSEVSDSMLLPSGFFYLRTGEDGAVTLTGGGFGHGCGMSQNAAKAYANEGAGAYEILFRFYPGTKLCRADG